MWTIRFVAGFLMLANSLCLADDSNVRIKRFDAFQPRDFGYVVGDAFEHDYLVEVKKPYKLDMKSFPAAGRLDLWLQLAVPVVQQSWSFDSTIYHIRLLYQIINAPVLMQTLFTPEVDLEFSDGTDTFSVSFRSWQYDVSPITQPDVGQEHLASSLQPDLKPPIIRKWPTVTRIVIESAIILGVLIYLFYINLIRPWMYRQRYPFNVAYRQIKLMNDKTDEGQRSDAIRYLHHALNQTAGKTLLGSNLSYFFKLRPEFQSVQADLQKFFESSGNLFFEEKETIPALNYGYDECLHLARTCRDIELSTR